MLRIFILNAYIQYGESKKCLLGLILNTEVKINNPGYFEKYQNKR